MPRRAGHIYCHLSAAGVRARFDPSRSVFVLATLKNLLSPEQPAIALRARVNRVHNHLGPERLEGLVVKLHGDVAYVAWPDGETTIESVRHLAVIVA